MIDKVYVSTNCPKISSVALKAGAIVIKRPENLCGDESTTEEAIGHWLQQIEERPDIIALVQCTSPFRGKDTLDNAIKKLIQEKADSLFFATDLGRWIWTEDNVPINYDYTNRIMTQDKNWELVEGGDYIFTTDLFEKTSLRLGGKIIHYKIGKIESTDIDDHEDLLIARSIASVLYQED